jgi:hypothetical protein
VSVAARAVARRVREGCGAAVARAASARAFLRTATSVQSKAEKRPPQTAKLPPRRGASKRIVCREGKASQQPRVSGKCTPQRNGRRSQRQSHAAGGSPFAASRRASASAHRDTAGEARRQATRRVVHPLAEVPDAAADGAHAERATYIIQNAVGARLAAAMRRAGASYGRQRSSPRRRRHRRFAAGGRDAAAQARPRTRGPPPTWRCGRGVSSARGAAPARKQTQTPAHTCARCRCDARADAARGTRRGGGNGPVAALCSGRCLPRAGPARREVGPACTACQRQRGGGCNSPLHITRIVARSRRRASPRRHFSTTPPACTPSSVFAGYHQQPQHPDEQVLRACRNVSRQARGA